MPRNKTSDSKREENKIRQSQLLVPFGVGALTDIKNQSVMIADSEYWNSKTVDECTFHDIRLQRAMKADGFIEPPTSQDMITVKNFPAWYFSPKTRKLKPIWDWRKRFEGTREKNNLTNFDRIPFELDNGRKVELVPVRIICVCAAGHVQDFPWYEWAHSRGIGSKSSGKHVLKLYNAGGGGTIGDMFVGCSCGCKRSLRGIFGTDINKTFEKMDIRCHGQYGWKYNDSITDCDESLKPMLRNANGLYFPNVISSVNIPLIENAKIEDIQDTYAYNMLEKKVRKTISKSDVNSGINVLTNDPFVKGLIEEIAEELYGENQVTSELLNNVQQELIKKWSVTQENNDDLTETDYRRDEYDVLIGEKTFNKNSERFDMQLNLADTFPADLPLAKLFKCITLLNQVEVVSILKSYSRIRPVESEEMMEQESEERAEHGSKQFNEISEVSLRRKDNKLVGIKNKGEGIFVALDSDQLKKWQRKIKETSFEHRITDKQKDSQNKEYIAPFIAPTFYLLHTLAHLVIRELSFASGYSSSALRERLYYSDDGQSEKMCGFLIYTSSADSEGTLGGLVRQGIPKNFFKMLKGAIEKARWCSFDPTCIDNEGQGRDSLNLAACHACALVSETSCERMNLFLDRAMLIGTLKNRELGFFSKVIE